MKGELLPKPDRLMFFSVPSLVTRHIKTQNLEANFSTFICILLSYVSFLCLWIAINMCSRAMNLMDFRVLKHWNTVVPSLSDYNVRYEVFFWSEIIIYFLPFCSYKLDLTFRIHQILNCLESFASFCMKQQRSKWEISMWNAKVWEQVPPAQRMSHP